MSTAFSIQSIMICASSVSIWYTAATNSALTPPGKQSKQRPDKLPSHGQKLPYDKILSRATDVMSTTAANRRLTRPCKHLCQLGGELSIVSQASPKSDLFKPMAQLFDSLMRSILHPVFEGLVRHLLGLVALQLKLRLLCS